MLLILKHISTSSEKIIEATFLINQDSFWNKYTLRFPKAENSCEVGLHVKNKFQMNLSSSDKAEDKAKQSFLP